MTPGRLLPARRAGLVGVLAVASFWGLVLVAGLLQPGYRPRRDYVSALASEGARRPVVGVLALLAFGLAYLATALVVGRWVGSPIACGLLVAAGLLTWVVALARIHCPGGAASCDLPTSSAVLTRTTGSDVAPHLHGVAVALSYACVAIAMLVLAVRAVRAHERGRAAISAAALVASLLALPLWVGSDRPGGGQRLWLAVLSAWLVLLCAEPLLVHEDVAALDTGGAA